MLPSTRFLWRGACMAGVLSLAGCGAGLITGIAASDRGNTPPEARVPELSVPPQMPLVPPPNTTRTAVVANAQIAAAAFIRVSIGAAGVAVDQLDPTATGQGGSTAITFTLVTGPIVAAVGDPTAASVLGQLTVFVDEKAIAPPAPVELVRQPRAELIVEPGASERFVSPLGERVAFRVAGLRSTESSDLQVLVTTPDPTVTQVAGQPTPVVTRSASDVRREPPDGGEPIVSAFMPGSTFPVQCELVVIDALAGQSTPVTNAYYRPDVTLALPAQGPTTGGSLVTLIGTALLPYDFGAGPGAPPFDFAAVHISFEKGGRVTELAEVDFRTAESGSDRLVFVMPPSPDGRPGEVDIVLREELGAVESLVTASQEFRFNNPNPFFGPRGVVFDRTPVAVATIGLDQAPSTDAAPDFVALTEQGGVAFLQLLLAQQNGMFQPFAAPRQIGDHENVAERGPRDLCVGDFNGDAVPDVFIANVGAATAVHHVVRGQEAPLPPLGTKYPFVAPGGSWRCRAALFDGDTTPDVLLVPGPEASPLQQPHVLLARPDPLPPVGNGDPGFAAPIVIDVRPFAYEAFEVADLDGDGRLDVAFVSGTEGKLDVAYGLGDGNFTQGVPLDYTVPSYTPDPASPAIGLHACRDGPTQSLGLVLAGLLSPPPPAPPPTPPTVTVLRQPSARVFLPPDVADTVAPPTEPIGRSLAANLDATGPIELVVAMAGDPQFFSLGMLQFSPNGFQAILGSVEGNVLPGTESPRQIRALVFDRAFPAVPPAGEPKNAVFIVHEIEVDGIVEKRLSTRLVDTPENAPPLLLSPDAGARLGYPILGLATGNFHPVSVAGAGQVRDLALARPTTTLTTPPTIVPEGVQLIANDGFGGQPGSSNRIEVANLLRGSLTTLPAAPGVIDGLLFAERSSRLGFWQPEPTPVPPPPQVPAAQQVDAWTTELRALLPSPWSTTDLADATCLRLGDVDGDGLLDLVVLLSFAIANPQEGDAAIALLRGRANPAANEFPFWFPTAVTPLHGRTSSIALGDFANAGPGQPRLLELAVAVPASTPPGAPGTEQVRFFRYVPGATPADDRFAPSAVGQTQVLLAGSKPTQLGAADFDKNGTIDLLVACGGDRSVPSDSALRLFRNTAVANPQQPNVQVDAFVEAATSPWALADDVPTALRLSDVNGDGNVDAIAFVEFTNSANVRSTSVAMYLSSGAGSFDGPRVLSPQRIGNRDARVAGELADWNRDGVPDLFLGWDTSGLNDTNLRILSGGTR